MSVLRQAVVFLLFASPAIAQSLAFETISVRPARSSDPRDMRIRANHRTGRDFVLLGMSRASALARRITFWRASMSASTGALLTSSRALA